MGMRSREPSTRTRALQRLIAVVSMVTVASLGLSGCDLGKTTDTASAARSPEVDPPGRNEVTPTRTLQKAPDKVCDGVETLFAQWQVRFVRWSPELQPFDPGMAAAVRNLAQGLAVKNRAATTPPVRVQVAANVTALNRLGIAMGGNNANRVLAAARQMRAAYAALTTACDPDANSSTNTSATAPTPPPSPPAAEQTRGLTCQKVQNIMVQVGVDLAAWSPEADPFDEGTSGTWRSFGDELAALAPRGGSAQIRAAITQNAGAFTGIADAMTSRHRNGVDDAIEKAGLAYLDLHRECSLH
jgi:hypothetical protein